MTWNLDRLTTERFERNPLISVVGRIDFESDDLNFEDARWQSFAAKVNEFSAPNLVKQERLRLDVTDRKVHRQETKEAVFEETEGDYELTISSHYISIKSKQHNNRKPMIAHLIGQFQRLNDFYSIKPTRVGLRYLNKINKESIEADVNRPLKWSDLITESFHKPPLDVFEYSENTSTFSELDNRVQSGGFMRVRYGFQIHERRSFFLDLDRYENITDPSVDVEDKLKAFVEEIYFVFKKIVQPELVDWMKGEET